MTVEYKINPLNVLGGREVEDPALHFEYIYVKLRPNLIKPLKDWIYQNLKYRFYIGESLQLEDNQYTIKLRIGFEEPKEASFFLLACSLLKDLDH